VNEVSNFVGVHFFRQARLGFSQVCLILLFPSIRTFHPLNGFKTWLFKIILMLSWSNILVLLPVDGRYLQNTKSVIMKNIFYFFLICALPCVLSACGASRLAVQTNTVLADKHATKETVALFGKLKALSEHYTIFGQQDYASDGKGWRDLDGRCDVKDVAGDYPGFYSFDFLHFTNPHNWESKDTKYLTRLFFDAAKRGNVISFCWHYYNPVTGGLFYDTTKIVSKLLPGGSHNAVFKKDMKILADFAKSAKGEDGKLIPIILRPWHELDGEWFWWGAKHCTVDEFKSLYRFTVSYLRDSLQVHNFLYAFSPDCRFKTEQQYTERYPGNDYVDLVGMDNYWDFRPNGGSLDLVIEKSRLITQIAQKNGKLAAMTETGLANLPDTAWYTSKLLKVLKDPQVKFAYCAVWRGEYVPFKGHAASEDFVKFSQDEKILFNNRLQKVTVKD